MKLPLVSILSVFLTETDARIGVGGYQPSEEEVAQKRAETEARLAAYRKSISGDSAVQDEHEEEIRAAQKEAQQMMRYGATKAALGELERVSEWLCVTTELGGEVTLELGLAYIANGQEAKAKNCFKRLLKNPAKNMKRAAQQMLFQEEAQNFMG